jgi:hypothetical protein
MDRLDYSSEAELFPARSGRSRPHAYRYRRFSRMSEAIRFAIEELPATVFVGTYLEVDEQRFSSTEIRRLYESSDYPLARRVAPVPG